MNYNQYLFSCLLKLYNTEYEQLPYDEQYDVVKEAYKRFTKSAYNNPEKPMYECIVDYLSDGNYEYL